MKPLIAVVAHTEINRFGMPANNICVTYTEAVEKAGGLAMILPFTQQPNVIPLLIDKADGFLFTGGMDVDPAFYGEKGGIALGPADPDLDRFFQIAVSRRSWHAKSRFWPSAGEFNSSMWPWVVPFFRTYLPSFPPPVLKHMQDTLSFDADHPLTIAHGSRLFDLFGPRIMVNSRHHQAIKALEGI